MILFLDIDGVLHPFFPREDRTDAENQHLSYLPHFATVLRNFQSVRLVIASDWRKRHTLDELRDLFGDLGSRRATASAKRWPTWKRKGSPACAGSRLTTTRKTTCPTHR